MNKFIIVDEHELLAKLEQGYEIIHSFTADDGMNSTTVNGQFMNNHISLQNVPMPSYKYTKFVMKASAAAQVLYESKKNEN